MTKEQLVDALRYCSAVGMCDDCWLTTIQKEFGAPFCDDKLKQNAADLIEEQAAKIKELEEKVPRWIPVTEQLPEIDGRYLVCRYDYVTSTIFSDILLFESGIWWNGYHGGDYAVTHWMPLPEAPKED